MDVTELPVQGQALLVAGTGLFDCLHRVSHVPSGKELHDYAEVHQRCRDQPRLTQLSADPEVLLEQRSGGDEVAFPDRQGADSMTGGCRAQTVAVGLTNGQAVLEVGFTWYKSPSLAVDPNDPDKLYLAMRWNVWGTDLQPLSADVPFRPYVVMSHDGGETWGEPVDIVGDADGEEVYGTLNHELVVAPDGTVYSFSREWPAPVPEGAPEPERRPRMFKSTDGGQSWETTVFLEDVESFGAPYAAVDPRNGNLYVVYAAARPDAPEDASEPPQEIYFTASEDGGETWSTPVQITDDPSAEAEGCPEGSQSPRCLPASSLSDSFEPEIDVVPNGRIDVAWYDFRNDRFSGDRFWDVYYTHSSDAGDRWLPNARVTKTSVDATEGATFNNMDVRGPMGLASTDDVAYVAWADSRPSGDDSDAEDAYFSRIRFATAAEVARSDAGESGCCGGWWAPAPLWRWPGWPFSKAVVPSWS